MNSSHSAFRLTALAGDLSIAALCLYGAFLLRTRVALPGTGGLLPSGKVRYTFVNILIVVCAQAFFLSLFGLYRARERFREPLAKLLFPPCSSSCSPLGRLLPRVRAGLSLSASVLVVYVVFDGVALGLWRMLLDRLFPQPRRRAVIVGPAKAASLIATRSGATPGPGVEVAGLIGAATQGRADLPARRPREPRGDERAREDRRGHRDAGGDDLERPDLRTNPPRLARGPARVAVPFRDDDRAAAVPRRGDLPLLEAQDAPLEGMRAAGSARST